MPAPDIIIRLVERFRDNYASYKSGSYNETQARREFIDPFFKALGWDVDNEMNYSEQYKEVVHEDSIRIGGVAKAPDYSFRLGGRRVFFLEAKKPSVNLKDDPAPAFQLRRYAWTAKLPLSILTDFEEFIVYDTRIRPDIKDPPTKARIIYYPYGEYTEKWDDISSIFSPDSIKKGAYERFSSSTSKKKGTAEVDSELLSEIEGWREQLARNIALRNPGISERDLNYAVQMTIDRIMFLRISEDRGIEEYGRLREASAGTGIYQNLLGLFTRADERYNSGLFHFAHERGREGDPDGLTPGLAIDDRVLKDLLKNLYYPDSPYEFSVMPPEILGQVYENFLGSVIRLTEGGRAIIEQKPEVRKAGGVYYTPSYIVDYIVKNTLGRLLEGMTPQEASGMTENWRPQKGSRALAVLDPACGSGSFLLGAYQYLIDWHLEQYSKEPEKSLTGKAPRIYRGRKGELRLSTAEKKRILLAFIHGVDIDPQAVEVTKLSLLLKVLEDESEETINSQLRLFQERALPDLGASIKCGNSLIGPDYYKMKQTDIFDAEESFRINAFDWNAEFAQIMLTGGFDAVIGNPPYVRQEILGNDFKQYAKQKFSSYAGTADLYTYFIEQSHRLLKQGGLFGMICSNKFMRANYGIALRSFLKDKTAIRKLVDFGELPVFSNASTFPVILLTENSPKDAHEFIYAPIKRLDFESLEKEVLSIGKRLDGKSLNGDSWTLADSGELAIIEKMKSAGIPLGEYVNGRIYRGVLTGLNKAFVIDAGTKDRLIAEDPKSAELIKPFIVGDDIRKYHINFKGRYLILIPRGLTNLRSNNVKSPWNWFKDQYPAIADYLSPFAQEAEKRWDKGDYWWELRACEYCDKIYQPKILYPDIAKESRFTLDSGEFVMANTVYFISCDDKYLLGILNSKIMFFYFKRNASILGDADKGGRLRWFSQDLVKLPIRLPFLNIPSDTSLHDRIVSLVTLMLDLNSRLSSTALPHERTMIERQIASTDNEIDALVYGLYGITEDEIRIVEGE